MEMTLPGGEEIYIFFLVGFHFNPQDGRHDSRPVDKHRPAVMRLLGHKGLNDERCLFLKQMELQDDGITLGLESSLGKDIVGIINNVFQAPWGGSHTCQKDEKALECSLCQSSILCYQLGCELLERLAPREEIRLVVRSRHCSHHSPSHN